MNETAPPPQDAAAPAPAETTTARPILQAPVETRVPEPLGEEAAQHLEKLLKNIAVMLAYVNDNGIALPEDLHEKISALLNSPEVTKHRVSGAARLGRQS